MTFMKGAPACCCCKLVYILNANSIPIEFNMAKLLYPPPPVFFAYAPTSGGIANGGNDGRTHVDHYHKRQFFPGWGTSATGTSKYKEIAWIPLPYKPVDTDNIFTAIIDVGSSYNITGVCTASVAEQVFYATFDNPSSGNSYIRRVNFDGTGDTAILTATGTSAIRYLEHCRYNDKLYYLAYDSGTTRTCLHRCDTDGSNIELVFDWGARPWIFVAGNVAAFDNARGLMYLVKQYLPTSGSPWYGEIVRMNLDGTSPTTIYSTGSYTGSHIAYRVHAVRYSHLTDEIYWLEGSNSFHADPPSTEPNRGFWKASHDGSSPVLLHDNQGWGGTNGGFHYPDIGCGLETLGHSTQA